MPANLLVDEFLVNDRTLIVIMAKFVRGKEAVEIWLLRSSASLLRYAELLVCYYLIIESEPKSICPIRRESEIFKYQIHMESRLGRGKVGFLFNPCFSILREGDGFVILIKNLDCCLVGTFHHLR